MDDPNDTDEENLTTKSKERIDCTVSTCSVAGRDLMLKCSECKMSTHFECTKSPAYQLFLYKSSKRKFICESCTGDVPKGFHEHTNEKIRFSDLSAEIKSLQVILATKCEESKTLLEKAKEIKHQSNVLKQKNEELEDYHVSLRKKFDKGVNDSRSPKKSQIIEKDFLNSIENLLDTKLVEVEKRIKKSVLDEFQTNKVNLDNKLDAVINESESYAEAVKVSRNLNDLPKGINDFKSILNDARNEQLLEEKERESRSKNFIIDGLEEKGENNDAIKINDAKTTELFFEKINIEARPTKYFRLGKAEPNKRYPLKLEMATNSERVMNNLNLLKGTEEELGKLSVKEDYTKSEREQIKDLVNFSKERNKKYSPHYWVVRGTPKNGICLVKLARR